VRDARASRAQLTKVPQWETSEVDEKGSTSSSATKATNTIDVQVKSVRNFNYVFFWKEHFDPREENLFAAVVTLLDGKPLEPYLLPSNP
jgi:hypothetical protein